MLIEDYLMADNEHHKNIFGALTRIKEFENLFQDM